MITVFGNQRALRTHPAGLAVLSGLPEWPPVVTLTGLLYLAYRAVPPAHSSAW